jgi:glycosyltransferase involved in cell wall biosynthesis
MTVVLHITEALERHGGTPRKLLYLLQHGDAALERHAFVTFVPGNLDAEIRAAGASIVCANSAAITTVTRCVLDAARRERASVICTHFTRALVCGVVAGRLLRLPVIHNAHGPATEKPPATLAGRLGRIASRWSYPAISLVTANSKFTATTLQKTFAVPDRKLRVISDPVVPRTTSDEIERLPARGPKTLRLVQVGGLIPVRRQFLLLDGVAAIVRAGVDVELLMVGDGPLRQALSAQSRALGIDGRVQWLGFRDDVGNILAAADMYVSAIDTEGFGIAVVEAMLHGLPVVLANGGAHPELTENGRHGVLFDARDPNDFARQVIALWSDGQRRASLASSACVHATRNYAPRLYAEKFRELVAEVLHA